MLTPDPAARATLAEVLSHPWMVLGFNGPPDSHMPPREPLRADGLDRQVIRGMTGFEFGSEEDIEKKLVAILKSEDYVRAAQHWEKKRNVGGHFNNRDSRWADIFSLPAWGDLSDTSLTLTFDGSFDGIISSKADPPTSPKKTRKFSLKPFSKSTQRPMTQDPSNSENHAPRPSSSEKHLSHSTVDEPNGEPQPLDPTGGFHPLLSIYYLVREKLERERVHGPGLFASSQLFLQHPSRKKEPPSPVPLGSKADCDVVQAPLPSPGTLDFLYENGNANSRPSDLSSQERDQAEAKKNADKRASDLSWQERVQAEAKKNTGRRASELSWEREQAEANKEENARRKEKELQRNEEEARRKEEEVRRKEEEAKEKEELRKKDDEVRKRETEVREHEEEVKEREEGVERREKEVSIREEEVRKCEEEVRKRTEEAEQKELEARKQKEALDVDMICARLFIRLQAPESFKKFMDLGKEQAQEMMDLLQNVRLAVMVPRPNVYLTHFYC